ncbi:type II toxin-antitoxin system HicA family toxin [Glaesserella parasuis]|uniref:type II toxin-antitoxin system HicA family toxin n=1 Tax=Glaesserella parasuis TaxID=738 RepID=UPI002EB2C298|nr:type II toxin-antitoxin system HicA family toxin [Glaesserella parasuis]
MRKKHQQTLYAIFATPTSSNIKWKEIESLIEGLGGEIIQGEGSRVRFKLNNSIARFHRPHPHHQIQIRVLSQTCVNGLLK